MTVLSEVTFVGAGVLRRGKLAGNHPCDKGLAGPKFATT